MASRTFEIVVEQKLVHRFTVEARSGPEAAVAVGMLLAGESPFGQADTVEIARNVRAPQRTKEPSDPSLDL